MAGRLIYLMGPSGSGKDTILLGLSRLMGQQAYIAPRVITRPVTHTEPHAVSASAADFEQIERNGGFAMSWRANGLAYGVRWSDIAERLLAGDDVFVNGSREYLPEARRRYRMLVPILLVVDDATLQQRLVARGREDADRIRQRMSRNVTYAGLAASAPLGDVLAIDNSGSPEDTIKALYEYLHTRHTSERHGHATDTSGYRQRQATARL